MNSDATYPSRPSARRTAVHDPERVSLGTCVTAQSVTRMTSKESDARTALVAIRSWRTGTSRPTTTPYSNGSAPATGFAENKYGAANVFEASTFVSGV